MLKKYYPEWIISILLLIFVNFVVEIMLTRNVPSPQMRLSLVPAEKSKNTIQDRRIMVSKTDTVNTVLHQVDSSKTNGTKPTRATSIPVLLEYGETTADLYRCLKCIPGKVYLYDTVKKNLAFEINLAQNKLIYKPTKSDEYSNLARELPTGYFTEFINTAGTYFKDVETKNGYIVVLYLRADLETKINTEKNNLITQLELNPNDIIAVYARIEVNESSTSFNLSFTRILDKNGKTTYL